MQEYDIKEIELDIQEADRMIRKGKQLEKLERNPAFIEVFIKGYLEEESIRLVAAKSEPILQDGTPNSNAALKNIDNEIIGIGAFRNYCKTVKQLAVMASNSKSQSEQLLSEIHSGTSGE